MSESAMAPTPTLTAMDPFAVRRTVLHVMQPIDGGVAGYVQGLASYQANRGWDVHVAAPDVAAPDGAAPASSMPAGESPDGVRWHRWPSRRNPMAGISNETRRLAAIVARVEPDTVVLHSAKAGLIGRLVLRGRIPTVYVPHAWSFLALQGPLARNALTWERAASRWTSAVVAVSPGEARLGVEAGITAPMVVVPNPVPAEFLDAPRSRPRRARRALGLPDKPTVVTVGRLCPQKGQDLLLDVWREVRQHVNARLVLVGDGPSRDALGEAADTSVTFVGSQHDVRPWLHAADLVAIPSRWEGMALSMLEALASGRSVVTHHVAGSDVVVRARAGASVAVGDTERFATALITRLHRRELARREGIRGAQYATAHHRDTDCYSAVSAVCLRAEVFGHPAAQVGAVAG